MNRRRILSPFAAGLTMVVSLRCDNGTGPSGSAGVTVLRGGGQTDTVLARLTQALVIEVRVRTFIRFLN